MKSQLMLLMSEIIHSVISEITNTQNNNFGHLNSKLVSLSNPRFAIPDESQPNGQGILVGSYPGHDVSLAIDGNKGRDGTDHAAHPQSDAPTASFFVDLVGPSSVAYVKVWPRVLDLGWADGYYEGMRVYAGSNLCTSKEVYSLTYLISTLIPNQDPMIFVCPQGTLASTIQLTKGNNYYVQLAEIEVFMNRSKKTDIRPLLTFLTRPRFSEKRLRDSMSH